VNRRPAREWRRRCGRLALVLAAVSPFGLVIGRVGVGASDAPRTARQAAPGVNDPLAGSVANSTTTWATVAMGKRDGDFDLFWELFSLNAATGRLGLVTPAGVASNGGLMVAQAGVGSSALIGFGASQDLKFSPLALSTNDGRTWSAGGLAQRLDSVPSSLGLDAQGDAVALVGGGTPVVLVRSGGLTDWKTLVSRSSLASTAAGRRCQLGFLEGVAVGLGGTAVVGASCKEEAVPGIFVRNGATWSLADISVPEALHGETFAVIRLGPSSALLAASGQTTNLLAAWQVGVSGRWLLSAALRLRSSYDLLATGTGPGGRQFVLIREAGTERAEVVGGPGDAWQTLAAPPSRTATLAFLPNGQVDAVAVDATLLSVWRLGGDGKSWVKVQLVTVPIAFGSS
jgi:hypothetical protein